MNLLGNKDTWINIGLGVGSVLMMAIGIKEVTHTYLNPAIRSQIYRRQIYDRCIRFHERMMKSVYYRGYSKSAKLDMLVRMAEVLLTKTQSTLSPELKEVCLNQLKVELKLFVKTLEY